MDKKELENKMNEQQRLIALQGEHSKTSSLMYILFGLLFFMFLVIIGLVFYFMHSRKQ